MRGEDLALPSVQSPAPDPDPERGVTVIEIDDVMMTDEVTGDETIEIEIEIEIEAGIAETGETGTGVETETEKDTTIVEGMTKTANGTDSGLHHEPQERKRE